VRDYSQTHHFRHIMAARRQGWKKMCECVCAYIATEISLAPSHKKTKQYQDANECSGNAKVSVNFIISIITKTTLLIDFSSK